MQIRNLILGGASLFLVLAATAGEHPGKVKVLVVTGGHGFEQRPFFKLFEENPAIGFTHAAHQGNSATVYERDDLASFDALVLYDMPRNISEKQKTSFVSLLEKGVGLVVLHHALVSFQGWPDYERIIGGRYPEEPGKSGAVTSAVGYDHDVDIPVTILQKDHPVTLGLMDFSIHDEIYWGFRVSPKVTPLISTAHPKSGKPLGWAKTEANSRIVYLQLGHGPEAFQDANYRRLVGQSIAWVARPSDRPSWVSLFDGRTLDGWLPRGGKARYEVEEGQIVGTSVTNTPNSFLCTTREYGNFILELEFKVDQGLNSGVQIRSHSFDQPTELVWAGKTNKIPAGRVHGLQVEIDPSTRAWSGGIQEEGARGWLNDLKANPSARAAFKAGDWNHLRIACEGKSVRTWLNGVAAADLEDDRVLSGFIALQVHAVRRTDKPLQVRFRNIRLKEL